MNRVVYVESNYFTQWNLQWEGEVQFHNTVPQTPRARVSSTWPKRPSAKCEGCTNLSCYQCCPRSLTTTAGLNGRNPAGPASTGNLHNVGALWTVWATQTWQEPIKTKQIASKELVKTTLKCFFFLAFRKRPELWLFGRIRDSRLTTHSNSTVTDAHTGQAAWPALEQRRPW